MTDAGDYIKSEFKDRVLEWNRFFRAVQDNLTSKVNRNQDNRLVLTISNNQNQSHSFEIPFDDDTLYNHVQVDDSVGYLGLHVYFVLWWGLDCYDDMSFSQYQNSGLCDTGLPVMEQWEIYRDNVLEVVKIHDLLGKDFARIKSLRAEASP